MTTTEPVLMPTRRRRRAWIVATLVVAAAVGSWLTYRSWSADWPVRMVLVLDQNSWPLGFSPDGKTLLTFGNYTIIPWDVATGTKGKSWASAGARTFVSGAYSPDGRTFVVVGLDLNVDDSLLMLFDVGSGQSRVLFEAQGNRLNKLTFPRFSGGGRSIRATFLDYPNETNVITWDVESGRETSRRPFAPTTNFTGIWDIEPEGRYRATTGRSSPDVEIRDIDADRWIGTIPVKPGDAVAACLAISRDRKAVAMGRDDGTVVVWDVATRLVAEVPMTARSGYNLTTLGFSPDGRLLIIARSQQRTVPTGSFLDRIRVRLAEVFPSLDPPIQNEVVVVEVTTGKTLATARESHQFLISPDGRTVATFGLDGKVKLRELPKAGR